MDNYEEEIVEGTIETPKEEKEEQGKEEEVIDWEARAKKAEAAIMKAKSKPKEENPKKSNDFGYDVKAYLKSSGIDAKEFDFVKEQMKESGIKDVDSLLSNPYFQSQLETHRELQQTAEAAPKGKRTGGVATDNVDYWLSKPIEEVPQEHRRAVVNAKLEQDSNKSRFYNG